MAKCKICGQSVRTANVFHSACWEREAHKVAEKFCNDYCRFPHMELDDEQLNELYCSTCVLVQLLNLGL